MALAVLAAVTMFCGRLMVICAFVGKTPTCDHIFDGSDLGRSGTVRDVETEAGMLLVGTHPLKAA